jgi:protein CpxP
MNLNAAKKLMGGLALAGALALTGVVSFAQQSGQGQNDDQRGDRGGWNREGRGGQEGGEGRGEGREGGFFGGRFAEKLNLTDAQKAQMQQIAERFRENTKALRRQGRGEREGEGFDAFKGGTFNESAVRAAAQARANRQVEMEVARARMMYEMYNLLTPEQKAQLEADRQQREQRRQEFRSRRNANPGRTQ